MRTEVDMGVSPGDLHLCIVVKDWRQLSGEVELTYDNWRQADVRADENCFFYFFYGGNPFFWGKNRRKNFFLWKRRLPHVSHKVALCSRVTVRPLLLLVFLCRQGKHLQSLEWIRSPALHHRTPSPATLCDLGTVYPTLQDSTSLMTTQSCPPRCLLQVLLLISSPAPTFRPCRTYRDVGSVCDDRGSVVCQYYTRLSKERTVLRGQSQPAIFHRTDRQPQTMHRRAATVE